MKCLANFCAGIACIVSASHSSAQFNLPPEAELSPGSCTVRSAVVSLIAQHLGATLHWVGEEDYLPGKTVKVELHTSRRAWALVRDSGESYFGETRACIIDFGEYRERQHGDAPLKCADHFGFSQVLREFAKVETKWAGVSAEIPGMYLLFIDPAPGNRWALHGPSSMNFNFLPVEHCGAVMGKRSIAIQPF